MAKMAKMTSEILKSACAKADQIRLVTGLSATSANSIGQLKQGFDNPLTVKRAVFTPKGSNRVINVIDVIDAMCEANADANPFVASLFKDASLITSKLTVLVASDAIADAVASTRKNGKLFKAMIDSIKAYMISEHGKLDNPKADKIIDNTPIKLA